MTLAAAGDIIWPDILLGGSDRKGDQFIAQRGHQYPWRRSARRSGADGNIAKPVGANHYPRESKDHKDNQRDAQRTQNSAT